MKAERDDPLYVDMDPDDAFERLLGVKPEELPEHVRKREGKSARQARAPVASKSVRADDDSGGVDPYLRHSDARADQP